MVHRVAAATDLRHYSFYGPAPLQHTLLHEQERTGVTVQTLHPKHFDRGNIVAQTSFPGIKHDCNTVPQLLRTLAKEGADLLIECVKNGAFLVQHSSATTLTREEKYPIHRAPKISPNDRHIDWTTWTAHEILLKDRVIGPLWSLLRLDRHQQKQSHRIVWSSGFTETSVVPMEELQCGQPFVGGLEAQHEAIYIQTCDNKVLRIQGATLDGGKKNDLLHSLERLNLFSEGSNSTPTASEPSPRCIVGHLS